MWTSLKWRSYTSELVFKAATIVHTCHWHAEVTQCQLQAFVNLGKMCKCCTVTVCYAMPQQNEAPTRRAMWTHTRAAHACLLCQGQHAAASLPFSTLLGGGSQREHILFLPNGDQRCGLKKKRESLKWVFSPNKSSFTFLCGFCRFCFPSSIALPEGVAGRTWYCGFYWSSGRVKWGGQASWRWVLFERPHVRSVLSGDGTFQSIYWHKTRRSNYI